MSRNTIFRGAATAIITPTDANGVNYDLFGKLLDWQIEEGVNALVVAGTTGEAATFTEEEHKKVISYAVERVNGRVPVIAGSGSNNTAHAVEMSKFASAEGADGLLVVTPYYNKCTQAGLVTVFSTIADAATKPIILYNVPSRTGVNIETATYAALADHGNISGIKEANGNISSVADTMLAVGDKLDLYSGNDDQIVPILSLGGSGVISVLANVAPKAAVAICQKYFEGDVKESLRLQLKYLPLIHALFCETNPIPVKAAMAEMGYCENFVRLPLTKMTEAKFNNMKEIMKGLSLIG